MKFDRHLTWSQMKKDTGVSISQLRLVANGKPEEIKHTWMSTIIALEKAYPSISLYEYVKRNISV